MDYDKTDIPAAYNRGRDHGPAVLQLWMDAVARHVGSDRVRTALDLGCGTGRFTQGLAERFRAKVIGIDPSLKMLSQAPGSPEIGYAGGSAEALPLAADSVDLIFISMVFHHFINPQLAAQECRRVLRDGGRLFLRTASREMISEYPYVPFFPTSWVLLEQRLPTLAFQQEVFQSAGLQKECSEIITQQIAPDLFVYADKLATKSDSILASLDDADFDSGLQAMRSHAASTDSRPVSEPIDFIVFKKNSPPEVIAAGL